MTSKVSPPGCNPLFEPSSDQRDKLARRRACEDVAAKMCPPFDAQTRKSSGQAGSMIGFSPFPQQSVHHELPTGCADDRPQNADESTVGCSSRPTIKATNEGKGGVCTPRAKGVAHSSTGDSEGPGLDSEQAEVWGIVYAEELSESDAELTIVRLCELLAQGHAHTRNGFGSHSQPQLSQVMYKEAVADIILCCPEHLLS
jgi:hypothetical protein